MNRKAIMLAASLLVSAQITIGMPLRVHPQNPQILEFLGRPTVLHTYGTSYDWGFDASLDYIPYFNTLQRDGMNLVRIWCFAFPVGDPADMIQPWPRATTGTNALDGYKKWDLSKWNQAYSDRQGGYCIVLSPGLAGSIRIGPDMDWRGTRRCRFCYGAVPNSECGGFQ